MSDQNKGFQKEEAPKTVQGAQSTTSTWKRLLAKKWVFPATYMAAAAIILTLMWVYQDAGTKTVSLEDPGLKVSSTDKATDSSKAPDGAVAVNAQTETMQWPVKDRALVEVSIPFYDINATNEAKQAAMIQYNNELTPHTAIDLKAKDGSAFDVLAALSGKVTAVEQNHPVVGNLIEITHSNGLISSYQSLSEVKVAKGAEVKKGDIIAKAGRNDFEKEDGVHLHFEVRQVSDNAAVNPEVLLNAKQ